jgi:hypothetical protein
MVDLYFADRVHTFWYIAIIQKLLSQWMRLKLFCRHINIMNYAGNTLSNKLKFKCVPLNFLWGRHDLVGFIWISTNWEFWVDTVRECFDNTPFNVIIDYRYDCVSLYVCVRACTCVFSLMSSWVKRLWELWWLGGQVKDQTFNIDAKTKP